MDISHELANDERYSEGMVVQEGIIIKTRTISYKV
jgi:hypothetical protein